MNFMESPLALTEQVGHGVAHFLFETQAGMFLVNAGVLLGVGLILYKGGEALWRQTFGTRSQVHGLLKP